MTRATCPSQASRSNPNEPEAKVRNLVRLAVVVVASWVFGAEAQTPYSYYLSAGLRVATAGVQAGTPNLGFLDIYALSGTPGYAARNAPRACVNEVYYFDLTTPFGQAVQQMIQTTRITYPPVSRIDFVRNPDGRCWLTLLQW